MNRTITVGARLRPDELERFRRVPGETDTARIRYLIRTADVAPRLESVLQETRVNRVLLTAFARWFSQAVDIKQEEVERLEHILQEVEQHASE